MSSDRPIQSESEKSATTPEQLVPCYPIPTPQPPAPPHPNFGWSLLWMLGFLVVTYGVWIVVLVAAIAIEGIMSGDLSMSSLARVEQAPADFEEDGPSERPMIKILSPLVNALAISMFTAEIASVLFALVVIRVVVGSQWRRRLAFYRPSLAQIVLTLLSVPAFLILPGWVHEMARKVLPSIMGREDGKLLEQLFAEWPLWLGIITIGICPGLGEELWCRGFLGRGLIAHYGWVGGVLLTSLIFGMMHLDPAYAVATASMGLWLHFVYITTRSLWTSIFLHALNNSTAVVVAKLSMSAREALLDKPPDKIHPVVYFMGAVLAVSVGWALYRCRTRFVPAPGEQDQAWRPAFPGVAYPPAGTGTIATRAPWPGWIASAVVILALGTFVTLVYLAETGQLEKLLR